MEFAHASTTTPAGWREWTGRNVRVSDAGLTLATERALDATALGVEAADVAVARDGTLYVLGPGGDLLRHERERSVTQRLSTADDVGVEDPRAICVVDDRVYVADGSGPLVVVSARRRAAIDRVDVDVDDPRVLAVGERAVYVLARGADGDGTVVAVDRTGVVATAIDGLAAPTDLAVDGSGRLYVLLTPDDGPTVQVFDAVGGGGADGESGGAAGRDVIEAFTLAASGEPVVPSCIAVPDESTLVVGGRLPDDEGVVCEYDLDDAAPDGLERRTGFERPCSAIRAVPRDRHEDRRSYYAIGGADGAVFHLAETERHTPGPDGSRYSGHAFRRFDSGEVGVQWHRVTLGLEASSASTQVRVSYYAADDEPAAEAADDDPATETTDDEPATETTDGEPAAVTALDGVDRAAADALRSAGVQSAWDLVERTPESIAEAVAGATPERAAAWRSAAIDAIESEGRWKRVRTPDPADALLEAAEGRYLHVRLELVGDVDTAPTVGSLGADWPRRSYLQHLPELFQEDGRSAAFLERFLSVFESAFTDVEEELETITRYFDPEGVDAEYLSWLGRWLAVDLDERWPEPARRALVDRAPELFRKRGTRDGLLELLALYLAHVEAPDTAWTREWKAARIDQRVADGRLSEPRARERRRTIETRAPDPGGHLLFLLEHLALDQLDREAARRAYGAHMRGPRSFVVYAGPFVDPTHRAAVERLVEAERPAHAEGRVVELRHRFHLEGNTFLGVNSTLAPREFVLGRSSVGQDAVLGERDRFL